MNELSFLTPAAAEAAFYRAFEVADLDAMMAVWDTENTILCIHPLGPPLQGVSQVRSGWQQIFANPARLQFQINTLSTRNHAELTIHTVYEHITVLDATEQPSQPILATNVYHHTERGWHMILHHAAPAPAIGESPPANRMH